MAGQSLGRKKNNGLTVSHRSDCHHVVWALVNTTTTLAAHGLEEHSCYYPDFFENHQFHVIYCVTLAYVLFSKKIHIVDSWFWRIIDRICWACAIFRWPPNLQACTDRRTDRHINPGWAGTLAARGLEEHDVRITLIFSRIISFMSFTVLLSHNMYFFRRISDSQFTS